MPGIRLVHFVPGRMRIKIDQLKGNPSFGQEIRDKLARIPGVETVEAHPVTGSVIVHFDPGTILHADPVQAARAISEVFVEACDLALIEDELRARLDNPTGSAQISGGNVASNPGGPRTFIPAVFAALGIGSLVVADPITFPEWHHYFWYAFSSFLALNSPGSR